MYVIYECGRGLQVEDSCFVVFIFIAGWFWVRIHSCIQLCFCNLSAVCFDLIEFWVFYFLHY